MKENQETLDRVAAKFEEAGLPAPLTVKPKLSKRDSLIIHVFLDHVFTQAVGHLRRAAAELNDFSKENDDTFTKAMAADFAEIVNSLECTVNEWATKVDALPNIATLDNLVKKLEEEVARASAIALQNLTTETDENQEE